ncbi:VOC family protein [Nocardioides sp. R-C-SC26]|uniref:VOC family protein n=1 Tax=Nocardioides sp. R-C-SC26 TaxID=2870414 RepID=UPI001E318F0E|nr:VOC family protein [Nocardioides sp. R-C-SC26]
MTLTLGMITTNALDASALAAWWARQFDASPVFDAEGEFVIIAGGTLPVNLGFQKVAEPTPGHNRLHLDLGAPDMDAAVEQLVAAGAQVVGTRGESGLVWVTLTDPEGNEFCVTSSHAAESELT